MNTRIKLARSQAGLTQKAFADELGLTRNFIAQVEMGVKAPSDRTIRDICQKFGINETWLRTGDGEMMMPQSRQEEMAALVHSLMTDKPESFRTALVTALLRFDPNGPEWEILERIYDSVAKELEPGEK